MQAAGDRILIFRAREYKIGADPEALQALAHDVFEQLAGALAADRIGVEDSNGRIAHRPRLEDRTPCL